MELNLMLVIFLLFIYKYLFIFIGTTSFAPNQVIKGWTEAM